MRTPLLILAFVFGCKTDSDPDDGEFDASCDQMCSHFRDLDCPEGDDFYDSDTEGPVGVPNTTCEEFCTSQMELGVNLNIECAAKAPTCEEIEAYRAMESCK